MWTLLCAIYFRKLLNEMESTVAKKCHSKMLFIMVFTELVKMLNLILMNV